jgi:methylamine--corrinoid protein Co-methyltransferase
VNIASHILAAVCYQVSYHDMGHMSLRWSHNTGRMGLWIYAMAGQAIARNTPMITTNAIYTRSGLGTPEMLWEVAASAAVCTVSGVHQMGIGTTGGHQQDQTSGLEARFNAEVSHAVLGWKREQANEFALECLSHYEKTFESPKPGAPFSQLYDLETLEPIPAWLDVYNTAREELMGFGMPIDEGWREVKHGKNRQRNPRHSSEGAA